MLHATWQCQAFPSPAATRTDPLRVGARDPVSARSRHVPRGPRKCWTSSARRSSPASSLPGSLHSVAELAETLGVSRTPVREALIELASRGMVQFERNRGVRILQTSIHDLEEIFEIRLMLEVPATAQAVARMSPAEIRALRGQLTLMEQAAAAGDESRLWTHDRGVPSHAPCRLGQPATGRLRGQPARHGPRPGRDHGRPGAQPRRRSWPSTRRSSTGWRRATSTVRRQPWPPTSSTRHGSSSPRSRGCSSPPDASDVVARDREVPVARPDDRVVLLGGHPHGEPEVGRRARQAELGGRPGS